MRAVITGINGQDGRILSSALLRAGYSVVGIVKPDSKVLKVNSQFFAIYKLDLSDPKSSKEFFNKYQPDLIFHLAAVHNSSSRMQVTEDLFAESMKACHVGITNNILDWQLENPLTKSIIALSSQMYAKNPLETISIDEHSIPNPQNMYGVTKAMAWDLIKKYREQFGVLTAGAILFNHASVFSKPEFLFSEIAHKIIVATRNGTHNISVRNPNSHIDITSAEEICHALHLMSQMSVPQDFVLGSGKTLTISEIISSYSIRFNSLIQIENQEEKLVEQCLLSSIRNAKDLLDWYPAQEPWDLLASMVESGAKYGI